MVKNNQVLDLVALLHNSYMLSSTELHKSGEQSFRNDKVVCATRKNLGTDYFECREYTGYSDLGPHWSDRVMVRFAFVTKVWENSMPKLLKSLTDDHFPDVIIVNSLFWDVTKYGHNQADKRKIEHCWHFPKFEQNLETFLSHFDEIDKINRQKTGRKLPCLKIWRSTMPIR